MMNYQEFIENKIIRTPDAGINISGMQLINTELVIKNI